MNLFLDQLKKTLPHAQERFIYWIGQREQVRKAQEEGEPKPWTGDPILQSYRFCNVRRMDDKVSQWLYENWYHPNYNHPNMLMNVVLARLINNPVTLEHVGFRKTWNQVSILGALKGWRDKGNKVFNGAYIVSTNGLTGDKLDVLFKHLLQPLYLGTPKLDTSSMERSVKTLTGYWGLSTFLGGQIVADLRWAIEGTWADRLVWAAIGPGSRRGMNRFLDRPVDCGMSQIEFNTWLPRAIGLVKRHLPSIAQRLEAIDVQNCFCEFDKYERCLWGEGTPKQRYPGS